MEQIMRRFRVAIGSTTDDAPLLDSLRGTVLEGVRQIFTSERLRKYKPEREFYSDILRLTGWEPEETVFVGDSVEDDVIGPKGIGMKAVLIDRKGITDPDLLKINEEYLAGYTENVISGTVRERVTLDGVVILGEGSVLLPGVYIEGVAVIGKNCKIGPNCYLRGYNFISDKCHIGQAVEIKNSILMTHVAAGHLSYIGDSIVCQNANFGAGTITSNFRHDGKNHRSMVQGCLIDTGRRKVGSIIGENVHTGIHTAIYPGRKIWADVQTRPGDVVQLDLMK